MRTLVLSVYATWCRVLLLGAKLATPIIISFVVGCGTLPAYITKNDAENITVSRPLIFSKETLVLERKNDLAWLKNELENPPAFQNQGNRFTREFSQTNISASIQADPTKIANYRATQDAALDDIDRASERADITQSRILENDVLQREQTRAQSTLYNNYLTNLGAQNDLTAKLLKDEFDVSNKIVEVTCADDRIVEAVAPVDTDIKGNISKCDAARTKHLAVITAIRAALPPQASIKPTLTTTGSSVVLDDAGKPITPDLDLPTISAKAAADIASAAEKFAKAITSIKSATQVDSTNKAPTNDVDVTPINSFEDKLAYRDRVKDEIARVSLDDRHDTFGNSLYRMQFNLGVIPQTNNAQWAKVEVELYPSESMLFPKGFFPAFSAMAVKEKQNKLDIYDRSFEVHSALKEDEKTSLEGTLKTAKSAHYNSLKSIQDFYETNKTYLPYSPRVYTQVWLSSMTSEVQLEFSQLLNSFLNKTASLEDYSVANRNLFFICNQLNEKNTIFTACQNTKGHPHTKLYITKMRESDVLINLKEKLTTDKFKALAPLTSEKIISEGLSEGLLTDTEIESIFKLKRREITSMATLISIYRSLARNGGKDNNYLGDHKNRRHARKLVNSILYRITLDIAFQNVSNRYELNPYVFYGPNNYSVPSYTELFPELLSRTIFLSWKKIENPDAPLVTNTSSATKASDDTVPTKGIAERTGSTTQNIPNKKKERVSAVWQLISEMHTKQIADVYSVSPKESSQRIADSAEVSRVLGIDVGASFLAGSTGGEAAISYLKGKERLLSTILRKPVILGLPGTVVDSPSTCARETTESKLTCSLPGIKFGWLIGPIYKIKSDRQDADFLHEATVKTVSADLSLPSWWKSVEMKATSSWITKNSLKEISADTKVIASRQNPIYLPAQEPDLSKIFRSSPRSTVRLNDATFSKDTQVRGGERFQLIIEGKDIWRVDSASIGNVTTDDIRLLGDMQAIQVKFPKVGQSACLTAVVKSESLHRCYSDIKLWSRHADPIMYDDSVSIDWSIITPDEAPEPIKVKFQEISPNALIYSDGSKTQINLSVLGLSSVNAAKFEINLGQTQHKTPITVQRRRGKSISLNFDVTPKDLWDDNCKGAANCVIDVEIIYDDKFIDGLSKLTLTKNIPAAKPSAT